MDKPHNEICLKGYDDQDDEKARLILWASGTYKVVQRTLRNAESIDSLKHNSPNVFILTYDLILFAYTNGIKKTDFVDQNIEKLYRVKMLKPSWLKSTVKKHILKYCLTQCIVPL